jgi:hypothetical protein
MVARLARVCDGYPIFLAPRSPARADWIEVLHRTDNWIELKQPWETLCSPAPLPGQRGPEKKEMTDDEVREQRKQEAILEALADDRVQDEESFRAAVRAREKRAEQLHQQRKESNGNSGLGGGPTPKRWAQEDGKEYPICTERAEAISRWIKESPISSGEGKSKTKKGGKRRAAKPAAAAFTDSFQELSVDGDLDTLD